MDQTTDRQYEAVEPGVAANEQLTALTGTLLLVLLAAMGITVLRVRQLLPEHFLLGFVLIPPLVLKVASTGYRFIRYYSGNPNYRRAGPPRQRPSSGNRRSGLVFATRSSTGTAESPLRGLGSATGTFCK